MWAILKRNLRIALALLCALALGGQATCRKQGVAESEPDGAAAAHSESAAVALPQEPEVEQASFPTPAEVAAPALPRVPLDASDPRGSLARLSTTQLQGSLSPPMSLFPEPFTEVEGVLTFRGDSHRAAPVWGNPSVRDHMLEVAWSFTTTRGRTEHVNKAWGGGAGWTGQPSLVRWPPDVRAVMNLKASHKQDAEFVEVVQASLDGRVYFLDLATGLPSRDATFWNPVTRRFDADYIDVRNPIKGSLSLDPRGFPLLYVGQGVPQVGPIGFRIFSLLDGQLLHFIPGRDGDAYRSWGAFDSSALINRTDDSFVLGGENGLLYRVRLNTEFDAAEPSVTLRPEVSRLRMRIAGQAKQGIENSVVGHKNLIWFADNGGAVYCVDLRDNKVQWVWHGPNADDTNPTLVLAVEEAGPVLFYGAELDLQRTRSEKAWLRKLDGITGTLLWERGFASGMSGPLNSGVYGTVALGTGALDHLVFAVVSGFPRDNGFRLMALDRATGDIQWYFDGDTYSWSSPLFFWSKEGDPWLIQGDARGRLRLIDARTGQQVDEILLGANIEASPAMFEGRLVVGTRVDKIFGIDVR
jgi:outer membrane protein assembly factor BamB